MFSAWNFSDVFFAAKDDLLLDDDEEPVHAELQRLKELRENNGVSTGESSERSQSWVKLHMKIAEKRSLSIFQRERERTHRRFGFSERTQRFLDKARSAGQFERQLMLNNPNGSKHFPQGCVRPGL